MKRFRFLLFLALAAFGVCGCAKNEPKNTVSEKIEQPDTTEAAEEHKVIARNISILDNKQPVDSDGVLWYIPNETVEASLQQEVMLYRDDLLLWGSKYDEVRGPVQELSTISLETGKVMHTKQIDGIELAGVQVCGDYVVVSDWSDGDVFILNQALQIMDTYKNEGHTDGAVYASPDMKNIYYFTQEQGIVVKNIKTNEEKILLENTKDLLSSGLCGNHVSLSYTDKKTQVVLNAAIDLEEKMVKTFPFTGAFYGTEYDEGIWFGCPYSEMSSYYVGREHNPKIFSLENNQGTVSLISNPTRLMTNVYNQSGVSNLTLYETDGRYLSQCTLDMEGAALYYDPVWSKDAGGYFFTVTDSTGVDKLMFWDFSVPTSGRDLTLETVREGDDEEENEDISKSTLQKAEEIERKYGIDIKIGTQCLTEYDVYSMESVTEEAYILSALTVLEQALSSYPDGFMRQLIYGTQAKTEFHLVKNLVKHDIPSDTNGFTSFVGVADEAIGKNLIFLDIMCTGSLEQTIYHEITHIIDNKLHFDTTIREEAMFSEEAWCALNPEGFSYAEDYHNIPMSFYNDGFDSSFIDIYSRTYAKEDRARIMEYAMIHADWMFEASEGRQKKLEYWCRCIRDAFDTSGWPEVTIWEEVLHR